MDLIYLMKYELPLPFETDSDEVKEQYALFHRLKKYVAEFESTGLGRKAYGKFLEEYDTPTPFHGRLKAKIQDYVSRFTSLDDKWFVFLGSRGTGKTYAASVIANELLKAGYRVRYTSLPRLLSDIKRGYSNKNDVTEALIKADYLVIDEFGASKLSDDDYRNLFILIDSRYADGRATVVISNANDLNFLGEALVDRFVEVAEVILFQGESLRGKNG